MNAQNLKRRSRIKGTRTKSIWLSKKKIFKKLIRKLWSSLNDKLSKRQTKVSAKIDSLDILEIERNIHHEN